MSHKLKISALSGIIYPTLAEVNSKAAFELKQKHEKPQTSELVRKVVSLTGARLSFVRRRQRCEE